MTAAPATLRLLLAGVLAALAASAGCNGSAMLVADRLAEPIAPAGDPALAHRWYYAWERQKDQLSGCDVTDMLIILGTRGRDWRAPGGPDGYPVRVCLLDRTDRPIRRDGTFNGFLVAAPTHPDAHRALWAWSVPTRAAGRHYRKDRIPGYLLRLDWGDTGPDTGGDFMLVIRWISRDAKWRLTRHIVFKDLVKHARPTLTTRPASP